MRVNLDELNRRIEQKLISVQQHPTELLYIYNYTPVAQYSRAWDDYTLMSRGLILDETGSIVARPFKKFFNLEEHTERLPNERFQVTEKLDGSLGILYPTSDGYALATRGSFTSDQAVKGTQLLDAYLTEHGTAWIDPAYTYLFEIIYPSNRIVVDYGGAQRLVLLAAIHTNEGHELDIANIDYEDKAQLFDTPDALEELRQVAVDNAEGYVIRFQSGLRVKMKFAEYVRLHRLLTQVSSKSIWELLKNGQDFVELIENVPDEFYDWVKETAHKLQMGHTELLQKAHNRYNQVKGMDSRKLMAQELQSEEPVIKAITFALLDGKEAQASDIAWKSLKPKYEQPFKEDIDA